MDTNFLIPSPVIDNCCGSGHKGVFLYREIAYYRSYYALQADEDADWWAVGMIAKMSTGYYKAIIVSNKEKNVYSICDGNNSINQYAISFEYNGKTYYVNGQMGYLTSGEIRDNIIPISESSYFDGQSGYLLSATDLLTAYINGGGTLPEDKTSSLHSSWIQREIKNVWQKTFAFAHAKTVYTDYANKKTLDTTLKEMKESIDGKIEKVDSSISSYSPNPVQNRVVKAALDEKAPLDSPDFTGSISLSRKVSTDIGKNSFAVGKEVTASGAESHAEGAQTQAVGDACHAEGSGTVAEGTATHAEGMYSKASNSFSHAEGMSCIASNGGAHAEGVGSVASGGCSHAEGYYATSASDYQHVQGKYNVEDANGKYAHIVGGGTSDSDRKNIYTLDWDGNAEYAGDVLCHDALGFSFRISQATFSHNIPRITPKDITSYITDGTFYQRLNGTDGFKLFEDIYVGDYIKMSRAITCPNSTNREIGSQYVTIVGLDTLIGNGDTAFDVHHAVMAPGMGFGGTQHFGRHAINDSDTTEGGYAGSKMNTDVLGAVVSEGSTASGATINQQLYAEFGSHLKTTRELVSTAINATGYNRFGSATGCSNSFAWGSYQSILMSEVETYGSIVFSSSGYDTGAAKMQLPLFAHSRRAMNNRNGWYWLKDVASASSFCGCHGSGYASYSGAGNAWIYVRPRFVIAA